MKIVVIIPTYNEADNISKLIPLLTDEFKKFPDINFEVYIVDGNSPDGTSDVVIELHKKFPTVNLLKEKEKAGLGAAYIYGFKFAINERHSDAVVEMDADLQHRPEDFSKLIEAFMQGYDYVIGSRYIEGGSIPKEWSLWRKILSIGGSLFTKFVLGIFTISDFTTGFKVTRVKGFLDKMDLNNISSKGFAYKIELLYRMYKLKAKIVEVPIKFELRDRGSSKMEKDNTIDSLKVVLLIKYRDSKNFFKFLAVGFAGLFVDSGLFTILRWLLERSSTASAISGFIAMLTTYTLNNFWSFKERRIKGLSKSVKSLLLYCASSYVPILFRSWLIHFSTLKYGDSVVVAYGAFFIGILFGLIWNYLVYSKIIWKK